MKREFIGVTMLILGSFIIIIIIIIISLLLFYLKNMAATVENILG